MLRRPQSRTSSIEKRSAVVWSRGGLSWIELLTHVFRRSVEHDLADRAALLSFYFLVALFPLLIALSTLMGFLMAEEQGAYVGLVNYLDRVMPPSAFRLVDELLKSLAKDASGGKLSLGAALSVWTASSGVKALIEALNVAFEVRLTRRWWRRRALAIAITVGLGILVASGLGLLLAGTTVFRVVAVRLPMLSDLGRLSGVFRWVTGLSMLFLSLTLLYRVGPNVKHRRWEGILPGAIFAMICWLATSAILRAYLAAYGTLRASYGSLAGVIALLFWLYLTAFAILLGGELNASIRGTLEKSERSV